MRKVLTIAVAAIMVVALVGAAGAASDNWRVTVKADNGAGMSPANGAQGGANPAAIDGYATGSVDDGTPYAGLSGDTPGTAMHVATYFDPALYPGESADVWNNAYGKNIQSGTLPAAGQMKTWEFVMAAAPSSTNTLIRPRIFTVSGTTMPYAADNLKYRFVLIDNKGMAGAPANGTAWDLTLPTVHSTTVPFWEMPQDQLLPIIKLSAKTNQALLAEGYRFQLQQIDTTVVPEPSSMLALGTGLSGLIGIALRRRRA